jgi:hypothetical protein
MPAGDDARVWLLLRLFEDPEGLEDAGLKYSFIMNVHTAGAARSSSTSYSSTFEWKSASLSVFCTCVQSGAAKGLLAALRTFRIKLATSSVL